jgi:hypothetical protein
MPRLSVRTFDKLEYGNVGAFQPRLYYRPADFTGCVTRMRHQELCISAFVLGAAIASDNCRHSRNMRPETPIFQCLSLPTKLTRLSINFGGVDAPVQGRGRLQTGAVRVLPAPEHCVRVPASSRQALWQAGRGPLVGASRRGEVSSRPSFWERHGTNSTRDPFGFSHGKRGG